jgi:PhnB protein
MRAHTYLNFAGNAEEAFKFYEKALGGKLAEIVRFRDLPMEGVEIPEKDQDKVMHVRLDVGNHQVIMASDTLESLGQRLVVGNNAYVSLHPGSKEEADRIFSALSEGGAVEMPMAEQVWGGYFGSFKDRFGVQWMINFERTG